MPAPIADYGPQPGNDWHQSYRDLSHCELTFDEARLFKAWLVLLGD